MLFATPDTKTRARSAVQSEGCIQSWVLTAHYAKYLCLILPSHIKAVQVSSNQWITFLEPHSGTKKNSSLLTKTLSMDMNMESLSQILLQNVGN